VVAEVGATFDGCGPHMNIFMSLVMLMIMRADFALVWASFCWCQDVHLQSESEHEQIKHRLQKSSVLKSGCCAANFYLGCLVAMSIHTFCSMITWGCQIVQAVAAQMSGVSVAPSDEHG